MPARRIEAVVRPGHGNGDLAQGLAGVGLDPPDQHVAQLGAERSRRTVDRAKRLAAVRGRHCRRERASDRARPGHRSARPAARASGWPGRLRRSSGFRSGPRSDGRLSRLGRALFRAGQREASADCPPARPCRRVLGGSLHGAAQRRLVRGGGSTVDGIVGSSVALALDRPRADRSSAEPNRSGRSRVTSRRSRVAPIGRGRHRRIARNRIAIRSLAKSVRRFPDRGYSNTVGV